MWETKKKANDSAINRDWTRSEVILKDLNTTAAGLAKELDLKHAENLYQIKKGNYRISRRMASIIHERYPQYSMSWLLLGE